MTPTPGMDLLLACARLFAGTGGRSALREFARQINNWPAALDLARAHRMEPLMAWYLKTNCADVLEPDLLANLGAILRQCAASHLLLCGNLLKVLNILDRHGIAAVPLKGPVLAAMLCDEIPWRDSVDLDLLVRRADITRAKNALLEEGYKLDSQLPSGEESVAFHWRSQLVLLRDDAGAALDLHWQLLPSLFPCARYFDSVWERLAPATFQEREILSFSAVDQLFFLCAHAARHSWHGLRLAADIARLIHVRRDLDWDCVLRAARSSDGARIMALGLWMVNRLLDMELPGPVARYVDATIEGRAFARHLLDRLLTTTPDESETSPEFGLQFRLASRLWPKLRCGTAYALLPTDADGALRLPAPLFALYYLYRPMRLTAKYVLKFLRGSSDQATRNQAWTGGN